MLIGIVIAAGGCATQKPADTSVKNTVYILESVKDLPTGRVFSFRDYCAFNAARGSEDAVLDRTLAEAGAWLELRFYDGTAELRLESSLVTDENSGNGGGDTGQAFWAYQKQYASRFLFTETGGAVELTLRLDSLDAETRIAVGTMTGAERDALLKSVFEKSEDLLIEPDEEDDVVNYWRRAR
jgi:hypothetical protein